MLFVVQIIKYNTRTGRGGREIFLNFTFLFVALIVRTAGIRLVHSSAMSVVAVWRWWTGTMYARKIGRCFACARHTVSRVLDIKDMSDRIIPTLKMTHFIYKTKKKNHA